MLALAALPVLSLSGLHAPCPRPALLPRAHSPVMGGGAAGVGVVQMVTAGGVPFFVAPQQKLAGAVASVGAAAVSRTHFWHLVGAFLLGGAFSTTIFAAEGLRNAFGTKNVQRGKRLLSLVLKRFWRVTITMLVAACVALWQGGVECMDPMECAVGEERSRWAGSWQILREGFAEAKRAATEGFEAIKQELKLYSAAVGQPGLVTAAPTPSRNPNWPSAIAERTPPPLPPAPRHPSRPRSLAR